MTSLSDLFTAGAPRYDLLVALNPGYHRHLRLAAGRIARWCAPRRVVDLGCGTGASTLALLRELPGITVLGVDASHGMVSAARQRTWPAGRVRFAVGRAQDLDAILAAAAGPVPSSSAAQAAPVAREIPTGSAAQDSPADNAPWDAAFTAYLLRNVPTQERDAVLAALHEHLVPGGVLAIQDYTVAGDRRARAVWNAVCWGVVIPLAALVQRDTRLYRYLWHSVNEMESVPDWCTRLDSVGFVVREVHHGEGWQRGILHTVIAQRPAVVPAPEGPTR